MDVQINKLNLTYWDLFHPLQVQLVDSVFPDRDERQR